MELANVSQVFLWSLKTVKNYCGILRCNCFLWLSQVTSQVPNTMKSSGHIFWPFPPTLSSALPGVPGSSQSFHFFTSSCLVCFLGCFSFKDWATQGSVLPQAVQVRFVCDDSLTCRCWQHVPTASLWEKLLCLSCLTLPILAVSHAGQSSAEILPELTRAPSLFFLFDRNVLWPLLPSPYLQLLPQSGFIHTEA